MLVTLRYNLTNGQDSADWINQNGGRLAACVLTEKEADSIRMVIGGMTFKTDRSPMLLLVDLEKEGFHFDDFKSVEFRH